MTKTIKAYKGFDKNLKCRGFQYEIGKEYEENEAKACRSGFHACEHPLDVFNYYAPNDSRYCEVEQSGNIDKRENDKTCSTKIEIGAELSLKDIVAAAIKFTFEKTTPENTEHTTGNYSAASATGDCGAASATGYKSAASATGLNSIALAAGYKCKAKGAIGSWLCIAERDEWDGKTYPIKEVRAVKVDGENIKPNTWFMLINGEITEVKE
ncbi:MAG: hypothetical protein IKM47_06415 [Bacteroidaceae bacterium]|nr:hypothetical protein [Bacteroidaceae bacterium]